MTEIRFAASDDREVVVALWERCGLTRPWNDARADFDRAIAGPTSAILIAGNGSDVLGTAMVGTDGHRGWVYYLAVDPLIRRSGIGARLMSSAEEWLGAAGAPKIQLMVRRGNDVAESFYRAIGFEASDVVVHEKWLT